MVKWLKNNSGVILIVAVAMAPIVIWLLMKPLSIRFGSYSLAFRSLGQITGLLGMALISINFILSARFKFLDRWFNGLNRVYDKHHLVGAIAFCLILFHPTFLIVQYLFISLRASFDFLFSFRDLPIVLGEVALLIFIVLMVITFYLHFKYQNWKNTHKYLGLVLLFAILHMLLVPSDISNNTALRYYMLGLAALAAASYLHRTIFGIYKRGEYKYKLEEVKKVNDSVVELKLKPLERKMNFLPGQFVFIRFVTGDTLSESHPFSITSSPDDKSLTLGIKTLGDYTSMVYLMKPGAVCCIEGPFGTFSYAKPESKRQIWMAGGIGVTPFLGMARDLSQNKNAKDFNIDLYYSVKNEGEAAFTGELEQISRNNANLRFFRHYSDRDGFISADFVVKNSGNLDKSVIFLCGPASYMKSLRGQFLKLGLDNGKIYSEEFNLSI